MITHEFDWGKDEDFSDDPVCNRCPKTLSEHTLEIVGITHEDETFGVDNSWKDAYFTSDW